MPRPRKYVIRNGQQIDGVSFSADGGYYIIVKGQRQYFGSSDGALIRAKAEYERQNGGAPKTIPAITPDEAQDLLDFFESAEVDTSDPDNAPEWAKSLTDNALVTHKINPEWARENPKRVVDYIATNMLKVDPDKWERAKKRPPTVNPDGQEITVSQVGKRYLTWYVTERGFNLDELERKADAQRASLKSALDDLQKPSSRRRKNKSDKRDAKTAALRRKLKNLEWVDMLPRKSARGYREQDRYFGEFTTFMKLRHGCDLPIAHLTGDDLRAYHDHVRITAHRNKSVTNPDKWRNLRYQSVSTAFRRVKKMYPDATYPQGFFGVDGTLSILECRKTVTEAPKIKLTPAEFAALLDVADTQWKAILYLSMNCALENESVSQIPWTAIDWDNKLMIFPRPKNGRIRQTPLASQTVTALRQWKSETNSTRPNIFITPHGDEWLNTTDSLGKHFDILKEAVKDKTKAVIPATFKAIRKTASSTVMAATHNEPAVEMLLGQAPAKSWRHYVGFAPEFLHDGIKAIEREFFTPADKAQKGGKSKTPKTPPPP